jgi:hypothetical protein
MFVKIKEKRINLDNVLCFWPKIDSFTHAINGVRHTDYSYNLHIRFIGDECTFTAENTLKITFDTKEELYKTIELLDHKLNM